MSKPVKALVNGDVRTVQVAPGAKVVPLSEVGIEPPRFGVCRLQAVGDGTFRPILVLQEQMVRISKLAAMLGLDDMQLFRLCRAGFVRYDQVTPRCFRVSLESWFEHQERVQADPWFWDDAKNKAKYSEAI